MSIVTCRSLRSRGTPKKDLLSTENSFHYIGGSSGEWRVTKILTQFGEALPAVSHIGIRMGHLPRLPASAVWVLDCVANHTRFVTCEESRPISTATRDFNDNDESCAALVLVRKAPLGRDPSRWDAVNSRNNSPGKKRPHFSFLPTIIRRLQSQTHLHEAFDEVIWFEYAAKDSVIFDELMAAVAAMNDPSRIERQIVIKLVGEAFSPPPPAGAARYVNRPR